MLFSFSFYVSLRFKVLSTDVKPVNLAWQDNGKHTTSRRNPSCPIQPNPITDCVSMSLYQVESHSMQWIFRNPN